MIVLPQESWDWLEQAAMDTRRASLIGRLRKADRHGRLKVYSPIVSGVPIHVHAKVMIFDDRVVRVGSANLANRSMGLDTECDIAIATDQTDRIARPSDTAGGRTSGAYAGRSRCGHFRRRFADQGDRAPARPRPHPEADRDRGRQRGGGGVCRVIAAAARPRAAGRGRNDRRSPDSRRRLAGSHPPARHCGDRRLACCRARDGLADRTVLGLGERRKPPVLVADLRRARRWPGSWRRAASSWRRSPSSR